MNRHLRYVGAVGGVGAIYWLAAKGGLQLAYLHGTVAASRRRTHQYPKYSHATAATLQLEANNKNVVLTLSVGDNGAGGADPNRGTGLRGLADRVEALGGKLELDSPTGQGTLLMASIPCEL